MGTRATWTFKDGKQTVAKVYTQSDGYMSGRGKEIADKFGATKLCNGFTRDMETGDFANGMGCFAAQVIKYMKSCKGGKLGGVYMIPPSADNEEYNYEFFGDEGQPIQVKVKNWENKVLYKGPLSDMPRTDRSE